MSKIKKVEEKLRLYRLYQARIENLKDELELLKEADGLGAIDYDKVGGGNTNKVNSLVEDIGLANIEKEHYIKHLIKRSQKMVKSIDRAMAALEEEEATVIEEWYFNNETASYISELIGVSERTLFRIKDQALENISVALVDITDIPC